MALWQYNFQVIEGEALELLNKGQTCFSKENGIDDSAFWEFKNAARSLFFPIGEILAGPDSNRPEFFGEGRRIAKQRLLGMCGWLTGHFMSQIL
jgi:hypothetical protein